MFGMTRNDWNSILVLDQLKRETLTPKDALVALEEACHLIVKLDRELSELKGRIRHLLDES
jgi:hypothetical protein